MPILCEFTSTRTKKPVFINPAMVCSVRGQPNGDTSITLGNEISITVAEDIDDVVGRLSQAG